MDIREVAARSDRDQSAPMRPQTDLQRRLESEHQMHHESSMKLREQGSPETFGEVDREVTMCMGALEGLYQRIGALTAILGPIMPSGVGNRMQSGEGRIDVSPYEVETEVGQRIQVIHRAISECEDTVGGLVASVRL